MLVGRGASWQADVRAGGWVAGGQVGWQRQHGTGVAAHSRLVASGRTEAAEARRYTYNATGEIKNWLHSEYTTCYE